MWEEYCGDARRRLVFILEVQKPKSNSSKKPMSAIKKSNAASELSRNGKAEKSGHPGRLRAQRGWEFVTKVVLPSMFSKPIGSQRKVVFPALAPGEIGITWIGHASFLIQTHELNILVDPNWAKWLKGIKRIKDPGCLLDDLPLVDLVLVTHAHFDHLDRRTLRKVAADQPIVVPFEVGNLVHDLGFHTVHELHYWESFQHKDAKITLTPCRHWGARVLHDTHRGFGGFLIEVAGRTIFHCGDTAYFEGFREIGKRHQIDVALLPIGAYDPPSQSKDVHMSPEEAVQAFCELRAGAMVPMHYGSFRLSFEPLDEPLARMAVHAEAEGVADRIRVMEEGVPQIF